MSGAIKGAGFCSDGCFHDRETGVALQRPSYRPLSTQPGPEVVIPIRLDSQYTGPTRKLLVSFRTRMPAKLQQCRFMGRRSGVKTVTLPMRTAHLTL